MARVSVSVDDAHVERIDEVVEALRARGLQDEQVLATLGVVTGEVADDRRQQLAAVDGVDSVDDEASYRLPPPDAPVQ